MDYVAPSFQIVRCRQLGGLANNSCVVIAGNAGNIAYVEGGVARSNRAEFARSE